MIKIAICDDEKNVRAYLSSLIERQSGEYSITEYSSASDYLEDGKKYDLMSPTEAKRRLMACASISEFHYDILFLDIEMKNGTEDLDGMALAKRIRKWEPEKQPIIIFVTGYEKYVYDAFDVNAFQYLLKPVDEEKFAVVFERAVKAATERKTLKPEALVLQFANSTKTILINDIYYIESEGHKVRLQLRDGSFSSYVKIGDLEEQLQGRFFRTHRGYLVNLSYVEEYNRSEVMMTNGDCILMSKYKYQEFVRAYLRYMGGKV